MLRERKNRARTVLTLAAGAAAWLMLSVFPARAALITPGAQLQPVYAGGKFYEGPTWDPRTARLYFTSLTAPSQVLVLTPPAAALPWLNNTQGINGTFRSLDGRLLCAQGDARRILSITIGLSGPGATEVLAADSNWRMPNDLCQTPSGDIYFTTPFGGGQGGYVYHVAPGGQVTPVITDMTSPNGIIAANDGSMLYVGDSTQKWWRRYPVSTGGAVEAGNLFFNPATSNQNDPDGMDIDEFGNLYFCGRGGLWIVSPQGQQLEFVAVPEFCTNAGFGGIDGRTLYLTCDGKVYSLAMEVRGASWRNVPAGNLPPQINAGPDRLVSSRTLTALLSGGATDDGLPDPPAAVSFEWSQVSGPGSVAFADPFAAQTVATFSAYGTYVLGLLGFDGIRSSSDEVILTLAKPCDSDGDGDVDVTDVNRFAQCRTGPHAGPPAAGCEWSDVDGDGDADQTDFGFVQRCLSGTGTPSDAHCAD